MADTGMTPAEISPEVARAKQRFSIIGNSPALLLAIERAIKVAPIDLSVLVTGPSGSGKEFFPKIIHQSGARKHKKYIAVNCGAIPEGTIDSELFGHEKGSFTGAISARKGYFEEADGGTIFLDEVAELPLTTQARLLRVLESGEFMKVGSSAVQKTDIRIVAATNVNLQEAVAKGRFREDLYYRLSTIVINVPPLRDRGSDVELLARKFAADFSEKYMTAPITFSEGARRLMELYDWPGNVRQLKNCVEQIALFEAGQEISRQQLLETLPASQRTEHTPVIADAHTYAEEREMLWQLVLSMRKELNELQNARQESTLGTPPPFGHTSVAQQPGISPVETRSLIKYPEVNVVETVEATPMTLVDSERQAVASALELAGGNRKRAAAHLKISERTLYRKIREFGLDRLAKRPPESPL